jgi:Zn-dependent M28 family amino/carboxypeptidase
MLTTTSTLNLLVWLAAGGAGGTPAAAAAAARVDEAGLRGHIAFLAHDLLEGRAPGSRGDELGRAYIAAQMETAGLAPGGEGGTFFQKVPLVGLTARLPKAVGFTGAGGRAELALPDDLVVTPGHQGPRAEIGDAEVVFVGYGIVAPEHQWDDFKDTDVRGKVLLVMNNDPAADPALFAGKTRLWYGRWDYKYHQAARKGAAAAIVIHTTESAGYPWQVVQTSNASEEFELPAGDEPRLQGRLWATEEASRRLARLGGRDLDALRAAAERRDFRPVPLGVRMRLAFETAARKLESANVLGVLPGADARLSREAVVFTAHHDHLGIGPGKDGDRIYNGALDNASGVAMMLEIARAAATGPRPRRSLLFAAVAAEEQGLLGSAWYCRHPTFAPGRLAANINIDSINIHGRTRDVAVVGLGKSTLDEVLRAVAATQGRVVVGDRFVDRGFFYRSDQFNFAKIGVPAIYAKSGVEYIGRPPGWGEARHKEYEQTRYHQPSDELDGTWDLRGAVEDARLLLLTALRVANAPAPPRWTPGDEFEAARRKALEAAAR